MPPAAITNDLWSVFKSRVDPVVRLLHKPTFQRILSRYFGVQITQRLGSDAHAMSFNNGRECWAFEALLFAVLYSAVNSLSLSEMDDLCKQHAGPTGPWKHGKGSDTKRKAMASFSYAAQQSLMKSEVFMTPRMDSLLAFCLLVFTRYNEAGSDHGLFTSVGVLLRCAKKIGLHIDPARLEPQSSSQRQAPHLTPVERETRRRLWHCVLFIDHVISEPTGFDAEPLLGDKLVPHGASTRLPSNISDDDLDHIMVDPATQEYTSVSDMTLQLVRMYSGLCVRCMSGILNLDVAYNQASQKIEDTIRETSRHMAALYEDRPEDAAQFKVRFLSLLILQKLWLLHAQLASKTSPVREWNMVRKRGLAAATSLLETYRALHESHSTDPIKWHAKRHLQLHPTIHILDELCKTDPLHSESDVVQACQRAWAIVKGHPPQQVMVAHRAAATEEGPTSASHEVLRTWGLVDRMKDQAAAKWALEESNAKATATLSTTHDSQFGTSMSQMDILDFTAFAGQDGVDYATLMQDFDSSFGADYFASSTATGFS
ncbi:MAG: hypothetical protein Q9162_006230 [Coniocarpon cinnabarinum]